VTQTKQASELSARNYHFEILQRIQKRTLMGENCFQVQIRQNPFFSLKVLDFNKRRRDRNKSFGLIANTRCFSDVVVPGRQDRQVTKEYAQNLIFRQYHIQVS